MLYLVSFDEQRWRAMLYLVSFDEQRWRAMLYLVSFDEQRYTRRAESFLPETLEDVVEFDASLTGAGILWYKRQEDGAEMALGGGAEILS